MFSNIFYCDIEGPQLYQEAAMEQFAQIEKEQNLESGMIASKAEYQVKNIDPQKKKKRILEKIVWKLKGSIIPHHLL